MLAVLNIEFRYICIMINYKTFFSGVHLEVLEVFRLVLEVIVSAVAPRLLGIIMLLLMPLLNRHLAGVTYIQILAGTYSS